jgi:hypothetical protein
MVQAAGRHQPPHHASNQQGTPRRRPCQEAGLTPTSTPPHLELALQRLVARSLRCHGRCLFSRLLGRHGAHGGYWGALLGHTGAALEPGGGWLCVCVGGGGGDYIGGGANGESAALVVGYSILAQQSTQGGLCVCVGGGGDGQRSWTSPAVPPTPQWHS